MISHCILETKKKNRHAASCTTEPLIICSGFSSGETVTSLVSMSPALPKKERKYRKRRSRENQEEAPPEIPVKGRPQHLVPHSPALLLKEEPFSILWVLICLRVSNHMLTQQTESVQTWVQTGVFSPLLFSPSGLLLRGRLWNVPIFLFFHR